MVTGASVNQERTLLGESTDQLLPYCLSPQRSIDGYQLTNCSQGQPDRILGSNLKWEGRAAASWLVLLTSTGLKVNDQLVAYATRFLAVRLKNYVWSHHRALKAKAKYSVTSLVLTHLTILTYSDL